MLSGNPHLKLRVNGILNGMGRRGSLYANSAAAAGIFITSHSNQLLTNYPTVLSFHLFKKVAALARSNDDDDVYNYIGSATAVGGIIGAARTTPSLFSVSLLYLHSVIN